MSALAVPVVAIADALKRAGVLVSEAGALPATIVGITDDSRGVVQGGAFIAVKGTVADGHGYLSHARAAGATLVIVEDAERADRASVPALIVRDGRKAAAIAAAAFYRHPAKGLRLVAVTGTNGKTTTVGMIRHILDTDAEGKRSASIGTLGVLIGSVGEPMDGGAGLTTPGPVELQRVLRALADRGVDTVAMEVSSHSLAQHRIDGVQFAAAVFTNLTRDHLDYHGTMEAYRDAKLSLASHLAPNGVAVVNHDDPAWHPLRRGHHGFLSFGSSPGAEVGAGEVMYSPTGSQFVMRARDVRVDVRLPLIGDFNVTNALGATAAALALGMPPEAVAARLNCMPQVPGRLERVGERPAVLRDYAHTPDALERALIALRPFVHGRLIVVFGAGGDRDPGKRPIMGAIAAKHADVVIVTSDNPRTENPETIIDQIVAGIGATPCERIEDRRVAIARALAVADPANDLVLLAGKGHEDYQVRGTEKLPFDEKEIVAALLAATAGTPCHTAMQGLP